MGVTPCKDGSRPIHTSRERKGWGQPDITLLEGEWAKRTRSTGTKEESRLDVVARVGWPGEIRTDGEGEGRTVLYPSGFSIS
jgi:hypothetical protein